MITKPIIKCLFKDVFDVNVIKINTLVVRAKKRRLGKFIGYKKVYKKVYITLECIKSFFNIKLFIFELF